MLDFNCLAGNEMKKVLIFTPRISGQRANYYNALNSLCDLTVISELDTPIDVMRDYSIDKKFKHIVINGFKIKVNAYEALCFGYKKYFKNNKYDKIIIEQVFTPTAFLIMRYLKKKNISFFASADGGIVNNKESLFKCWLKKLFISLPNYWLTSGKGGYCYLNNYGVQDKYIHKFIFSPYNENDIPKIAVDNQYKESLKKNLGIDENIIILMVGQPIYRKGHDLVLRAIENFDDDIGVYIIGGGPNKLCKDILDSQMNSSSGVNVHYVGFIDKNRLKEYYMLADIFVFPSRYDIWGYPVQEAMSFGLPVISSDAVNSAIELVENNINGYVFNNENVDELRDKLLVLINNKELRETISKNNIEKSKMYTSENMAKSVYGIICSME